MQTHQIQQLYKNQQIKVLLLLEINQTHYKFKSLYSYTANIQPIAIVIVQSGEITALDMQAKELSIDKLGLAFPGLAKVM